MSEIETQFEAFKAHLQALNFPALRKLMEEINSSVLPHFGSLVVVDRICQLDQPNEEDLAALEQIFVQFIEREQKVYHPYKETASMILVLKIRNTTNVSVLNRLIRCFKISFPLQAQTVSQAGQCVLTMCCKYLTTKMNETTHRALQEVYALALEKEGTRDFIRPSIVDKILSLFVKLDQPSLDKLQLETLVPACYQKKNLLCQCVKIGELGLAERFVADAEPGPDWDGETASMYILNYNIRQKTLNRRLKISQQEAIQRETEALCRLLCQTALRDAGSVNKNGQTGTMIALRMKKRGNTTVPDLYLSLVGASEAWISLADQPVISIVLNNIPEQNTADPILLTLFAQMFRHESCPTVEKGDLVWRFCDVIQRCSGAEERVCQELVIEGLPYISGDELEALCKIKAFRAAEAFSGQAGKTKEPMAPLVLRALLSRAAQQGLGGESSEAAVRLLPALLVAEAPVFPELYKRIRAHDHLLDLRYLRAAHADTRSVLCCVVHEMERVLSPEDAVLLCINYYSPEKALAHLASAQQKNGLQTAVILAMQRVYNIYNNGWIMTAKDSASWKALFERLFESKAFGVKPDAEFYYGDEISAAIHISESPASQSPEIKHIAGLLLRNWSRVTNSGEYPRLSFCIACGLLEEAFSYLDEVSVDSNAEGPLGFVFQRMLRGHPGELQVLKKLFWLIVDAECKAGAYWEALYVISSSLDFPSTEVLHALRTMLRAVSARVESETNAPQFLEAFHALGMQHEVVRLVAAGRNDRRLLPKNLASLQQTCRTATHFKKMVFAFKGTYRQQTADMFYGTIGQETLRCLRPEFSSLFRVRDARQHTLVSRTSNSYHPELPATTASQFVENPLIMAEISRGGRLRELLHEGRFNCALITNAQNLGAQVCRLLINKEPVRKETIRKKLALHRLQVFDLYRQLMKHILEDM